MPQCNSCSFSGYRLFSSLPTRYCSGRGFQPVLGVKFLPHYAPATIAIVSQCRHNTAGYFFPLPLAPTSADLYRHGLFCCTSTIPFAAEFLVMCFSSCINILPGTLSIRKRCDPGLPYHIFPDLSSLSSRFMALCAAVALMLAFETFNKGSYRI